MKIAIVGAGPAGLLAAWGVTRSVHLRDIMIFDPAPEYRPERIFALQYLHEDCNLPPQAIKVLGIDYVIQGVDPRLQEQVGFLKAAKYQYNAKLGRPLSEENSTRYAAKQAGTETRDVYSLRTAYQFLHKFFEDRMMRIGLTWDQIVGDLPKEYDCIISTAPLPRLLPDMEWPTINMYITQDYLPIEIDDGICVLNVDSGTDWTRATRLDGGKATEWARPPVGRHPYPVGALLQKIIAPPKLPVLPDNVYLAGRWGSWDAGVLTHHAYHRARNIIEGSVR